MSKVKLIKIVDIIFVFSKWQIYTYFKFKGNISRNSKFK